MRNSSSVVWVQHTHFHPCLTASELQWRDSKHSLDEAVRMNPWLPFETTGCWDTQASRHLPWRAASRRWKWANWDVWEVAGIGTADQLEAEAPSVWDRATGSGVALLGLLPWFNLPSRYPHSFFIVMRRGILCLWFYKVWWLRDCFECQKELWTFEQCRSCCREWGSLKLE